MLVAQLFHLLIQQRQAFTGLCLTLSQRLIDLLLHSAALLEQTPQIVTQILVCRAGKGQLTVQFIQRFVGLHQALFRFFLQPIGVLQRIFGLSQFCPQLRL